MKKCIVFLLFLCMSFAIIVTPIHAQSSSQQADYLYSFVLYDYTIQRNGVIPVEMRMNLEALDEVESFDFEIPYEPGQSIEFLQIQREDFTDSEEKFSLIGQRSNTPLNENSPIDAYYVQDTGYSLRITSSASVPEGESRQIVANYRIYQSATRYSDIGIIRNTLLSSTSRPRIERLAMIFAIEATVFEEENEEFLFLQRDNTQKRENLLESLTYSALMTHLNEAKMARERKSDTEYYYYGEAIPNASGFRFRVAIPSVWLSRMSFSQEAAQRDLLLEDQRSYEITKIRQYDFRQYSSAIVVTLFVLAIIAYFIIYSIDRFKTYQISRKAMDPIQSQHPYSALAFLESLRLNEKLLATVLFELIEAGYLRLENGVIVRVTERLLPDEKKLFSFQRMSLHWFWDLMEGEDTLDLTKLEELVQTYAPTEFASLNRIRNAYEIYAMQNQWVPSAKSIRLRKFPLILGISLLLIMIVSAIVGLYTFPLILLIPIAYSFLYARYSVLYSEKGFEQIRINSSYEYFMREIDEQKIEKDYLLDHLESYLIASIALDCNKEFTMNLRYRLTIKDVLETSYLRKYGFHKLQNRLRISLHNKDASAKQTHTFFSYIMKSQEELLKKLQNVFIRLYYRSVRKQGLLTRKEGLDDQRNSLEYQSSLRNSE